MAKAKTAKAAYRCSECGWQTSKWVGRCGECQTWGTVVEAASATPARIVAAGPVSAPARPIGKVDVRSAQAKPTGLDELDRSSLHVVLEGDPIGEMLASGDRYWRDGLRQRLMTQHVVGVCGLLDPVRRHGGKLSAGAQRCRQRPLLVDVEHHTHIRADHVAHEIGTAHIAVRIA